MLQPDPDSPLAQRFAINSRAEAAAYLQQDVLGQRLVECTRLAVSASDKSIADILGSPDDMKFRSIMTLCGRGLEATDLYRSYRGHLSGRQRSGDPEDTSAKLVDRGLVECGTAPFASWRAADDASHRNQSVSTAFSIAR
ncbi:DUF1810 family protein [Bradyrhizobium sp. SZCCHNRI1073]|uniref:DUF1810 family protein n=1 Tax=Bradyrhizobium sp. SZCCHNRI1073 TaxID=3057280 RepID=UPI002916DF23|nr:DUF1810 family protein [Bradyrhizobium sp. SZCCHNRI1073]